jgi:hypothetical protein
VTIDLKNPDGRALFLRLAERADLVVENFAPGLMERLGLDYERLRGVNPKIIVARIKGFGLSGGPRAASRHAGADDPRDPSLTDRHPGECLRRRLFGGAVDPVYAAQGAPARAPMQLHVPPPAPIAVAEAGVACLVRLARHASRSRPRPTGT